VELNNITIMKSYKNVYKMLHWIKG
jgi:hypothetical protein